MESINTLKMKKEYNGSLTKLFNTPIKYEEPNEVTSWSAKCGTYAVSEYCQIKFYKIII